ncbi:hydroxymethylbilane synthase [Sulfobacillus thermosulfidooxidans]|uniref:hydroxymethylbilane synthase n=1 Tax=Sulfobacillus thermosulfidooxidans TaxID=28034 RepID=UPI00096B9BA7|nr:hydroxymethylbilane synthase [Sulfobacillus thermosulfidooxidans]OLZ09843.1 hydroxymethylbilane synthase [Sulfobacillus thermosulfidooxidans]OLZ15851.1 hydroxymethylbilane synthase [Sulfobacillus thermosulfidooxidans]OLZ18302.1 hydroxymethylbilane synthase [Sulfobacillus thermosulfidooxidans]
MLKIGTRSSQLAQAQAQAVSNLLTNAGIDNELVLFETKGDKILDRALDAIGDKGLFTTELEKALLDGLIDVAVHSLKDLPTALSSHLMIGAYVLPEDPRDVLIAKPGVSWNSLPQGARIGTSSLRRTAFLKALRPDLDIVPVRGNLQTRVRKWKEKGWDGLVLAAAGVHRLHWQELISSYLDPWICVPSPGQGVLAVQVRDDNKDLRAILARFNDSQAEITSKASRAVLAELGGGCQIPFGAYATWTDEKTITIRGKVADLTGRRVIVRDVAGPGAHAEELGKRLAQELISAGALQLL